MGAQFDDFYNKTNYYSGGYTKGLKTLIEDLNIITGNALDIGAGQGRNSFLLHEKGFKTYAVEPSLEGCKTIKKLSKELKEPINVINSTYLNFDDKNIMFDLIIAITSLDHMNYKDVVNSVKKIKASLNYGGYVYITCFLEDDQGNIDRSEKASDTAIFINHYFKKNELKSLFEDFKIIKYEEVKSVDLSHGPRHYHSTALLIAQKAKAVENFEMENEKFLKKAIEISKKSNHPYGAIVVRNHKIIGRSDSLKQKSILEHAEYRAILDAVNHCGIDLKDSVLYCSCEPCVCCCGAILNTNIDKIVFGATLEDSKKYYFYENTIKAIEINKLAERPLKVVEEVCRKEAVEVLKKASFNK